MGRALIALGAIVWIAALIATVRDRKSKQLTRVVTLVILVAAAAVAVILYIR